MPKATAEARQQNAHERALATVAGLPKVDMSEYKVPDQDKQTCPGCSKTGYAIDEFLSPHNGLCSECQAPKKEEPPLPETAEAEVIETKPEPKPRQRKPQVQAQEEASASGKRQPSEDFFEYLQRITPEEWSNSQTAGLYLYKKTLKGNVRLNDEPLKAPITISELREQYYPIHGDGNYRVQFTTSLKNLTSCGENVTFDAQGASLGGAFAAPLGRNLAGNGDNGLTDAIKATSEMLKDGAKAAVEVSKAQQMEQTRPIDIAGAITAALTPVISLMNRPVAENGNKELLQFLITDANRRADESSKRAEDQRRQDREDADRRERLAKEEYERRDRDRKEEMERRDREYKDQREREQKFWEFQFKEKEKKSDEFGLTDLLKGIVVPLVKERIEGGGSPEGWAGVVGNLIEQVPNAVAGVSAITAARNGASPQQVQQIAQPQQQHPQEIPPFYDMHMRLDRYFAQDPQLYEGEYVLRLIEVEYDAVYSDFFKQPKDQALNAIAAFEPFGKRIMERPQSAEFMSKVIDAIKFPDTMDDIFGGEPEPDDEKEPIILHGKARKINGRAKVERAG